MKAKPMSVNNTRLLMESVKKFIVKEDFNHSVTGETYKDDKWALTRVGSANDLKTASDNTQWKTKDPNEATKAFNASKKKYFIYCFSRTNLPSAIYNPDTDQLVDANNNDITATNRELLTLVRANQEMKKPATTAQPAAQPVAQTTGNTTQQ